MLQIRVLTEYDAAAYHALRLAGLHTHPTAFTSSFEEDSAKPLEWARARLAPKPATPHAFVLGAFVDGVLAGIVGLAADARAKVRHKAEIFGMIVDDAHARRGIGRALLDECIARGRKIPGLSELRLTVTETNMPARALYESVGFRIYGVEPRAVIVAGVPYAKCHMELNLLEPLFS